MPFVHHQAGHSLHYRKTGSGNTVVLWFHGFGQQHQAFDKILFSNTTTYTHYTFDLFFHGHSTWASTAAIEKNDLQTLFSVFLNDEGINQFNVVAFSMGCRFAVTLAQQFSDRVQKLVMLAPDGIQFRFWYAIATYPYLSRKLFHRIVTHPAFWNRLLSIFEITHIIDKKLLRFAQRQMDSQQKREQVYNTWVNFRHLKINTTSLARLAETNGLSITLIAGKRDKIVPATLVQKLTRQIPQIQFFSFDANHNELIGVSGEVIFKVLRNQ